MLQYIKQVVAPYIPHGSMLLMDNLASHKTHTVLDHLAQGGARREQQHCKNKIKARA
jgi:hypothetical protein